VEEIASCTTESTLEKDYRNYNIIGVWCRDVLILDRVLLKDDTGREEVIVD
jgi:hypothetical protein